tara:strand:+ start:427 stop:1026 length:600 start_codon:yes stop_codon:yes gene_type:complete
MPPKKKISKNPPSWRDVRIGRGTKVANPIPPNLRKQSATRHDIEHGLQYHVNKQNLNKNPLRLSPLTVSNKDYFNPSEDGKVTIKDGSTPRYTGKLTPITFDTVNPPSLLSYRGKKIPPKLRSTSPLTYPGNYPGIKGTGEKAAKRAERELASIRPRSYDGGRKTRRKKKRTRTRKRKRTRKKKKKRRRRTKKKRRRRR